MTTNDEAAQVLRTFAELSDFLIDHDIELCGNCYMRHLHREVAREIRAAIENGDNAGAPDAYEGALHRWTETTAARWNESKYVRLWVAEQEAGRDPREAFKARGWEP